MVALPSLSNRAAGELTRLLLATKARLAATSPEAGELAAPATEKDALRLAHPGSVDFLKDERPDLLEKSTDIFLVTSVLAGFVGWLVSALARLRSKKKIREFERLSGRLPLLLSRA